MFDEFIIAMSAVPGRFREGMLLLSGDVLLLFNPLLIDYPGHGAAAISFKEAVSTGKNHGVYLRGEDGNVASFLHKQSEDGKSHVGMDCVLSYIDICDEDIPEGVVLHGLKQNDGKFVCRIYGVEDNPKENHLFGQELTGDLWDEGDGHPGW